jgi:hypothetical protein
MRTKIVFGVQKEQSSLNIRCGKKKRSVPKDVPKKVPSLPAKATLGIIQRGCSFSLSKKLHFHARAAQCPRAFSGTRAFST